MILTLLGKPGCHLCEEMREVLEVVLPEFGAVLEEQDVRVRPEHACFLWEIPVLLRGEQVLFRHRVEEAELRVRLREVVGEMGNASDAGLSGVGRVSTDH